MDVGNAARALWELLPRRMQERIADALGLSVANAERVVVLLAGVHDLRKASAFQTKADYCWANVRRAGFDLRYPADEPHAFVTANVGVLPRLLQQTTACGWAVTEQKLAVTLASITGAHHGKFPARNSMSEATLGGARWARAREMLAERLAEALYPGSVGNPVRLAGAALTDVGVGAVLAGLIAVADWVGSTVGVWNRGYTPLFALEPGKSLAEYTRSSEERAEK